MFEVHSSFNDGTVLPATTFHSLDEALRFATQQINSAFDVSSLFLVETKVVLNKQILFIFSL